MIKADDFNKKGDSFESRLFTGLKFFPIFDTQVKV